MDYADAFWTFGEYARRYACGPERRDTVYVGTSGGVVYLDCGPTNVMKMRRVDLGRVLYEITVVSADAWWEARMVDHVMRKSKKYLGVRLPIWVEKVRPGDEYGRVVVHAEDRLYLPLPTDGVIPVYHLRLPKLGVSVYLHGFEVVRADDELMELRAECLDLYHEFERSRRKIPDDIDAYYYSVVAPLALRLWYPNLVRVYPNESGKDVREYLEYVKHILRDVLVPRLREELTYARLAE